MASLIHKLIWEDKKGPDDEGNILIVRIEHGPKKRTGLIEVVSPAEDEYGRPCKKRLQISGTAFSEVMAARKTFEDIDNQRGFRFNTTSDGATIQLRYEGTSPLVVMCEVAPYTTPAEITRRYVIGDGKDVRFVIGSLEDLQAFSRKLETSGVGQ